MAADAELLAANAAFYRAFDRADEALMATLWAADHPVSCIHPGWTALLGRDAVLTSWHDILAASASPTVACRQPHAHLAGEFGYVLCYETVDGQLLAATNIFCREGADWKLVHHQAGPCAVVHEESDVGTRH